MIIFEIYQTDSDTSRISVFIASFSRQWKQCSSHICHRLNKKVKGLAKHILLVETWGWEHMKKLWTAKFLTRTAYFSKWGRHHQCIMAYGIVSPLELFFHPFINLFELETFRHLKNFHLKYFLKTRPSV